MSIAARRRREREERRQSILDAAERAFSQHGFDQATMDDIATHAELSKGTLYLYFKSKDDLFTALATRVLERVASEFEHRASAAATGMDAIRALLASYAENVLVDPRLFRIMMGRLASGHLLDPDTPSFASHRAQIERLVATFVAAIERGKRDGSMRSDIDARQTSSQLWGGLLGTILIRINGAEMARRFPQPVDFTRFIDGYIDLVCNGLRTDAADNDTEAPT